MVGLSATAETVAHFEVYLIKNDHFGPCLDLPTGTAQWASNYGVMNLTHRRVHHGNMVGFLQIQWLHPLCERGRLSVNTASAAMKITTILWYKLCLKLSISYNASLRSKVLHSYYKWNLLQAK